MEAPLTNIDTPSAGAIPLGLIPAYHAARNPNRPSVTVEDRTITCAELEAGANRRARAFAELGVKEGDFVTIALPNSVEHFETAFAIWKLGATPNVVSWRLPDPELLAIIELAQPRLVVGCESARLPGTKTLPVGWQPRPDLSAEPLPPRVSKHWKAMTSGGSTGRPKIIVDHMPGQWDPTRSLARQPVNGVVLNPGPLYHNGPFINVALAVAAGNHVVNLERFDPLRTLELAERHRANWICMVPTMMHRIWRLPEADRGRFDLSSVQTVIHMAAPCAVWLKEAWIDWLGPDRIWEVYAGTERLGATMIDGNEWRSHRGSVGRVQPGARIVILDSDRRPCKPHEIGEVYFLPDAGQGSSYHYLGADARTSGEWESIGDLGYFDDEGYLYLADRRTDMIITGGANIYPAEVEAAVESHEDVACCVALGLPDEDLGQRVHALVQVKPDSNIDALVLRTFLESRIAGYKIPRSFEFVTSILRDDAGKVRRSVLREERLPSKSNG